MMSASTECESCGSQPRKGARFCDACGAPITALREAAEYKQVTVLSADVVRSMDIAVTVGPERLREIMADLVTDASAVVRRYGGTVQSFTGDGIMALFGAPVAMEDHAVRACRAALDIQRKVQGQADNVHHRDGITLQLRIGLNSGQVIAGEIASAALGYTGIGDQEGMAQRMESVAPPGGVMISESTARLVAHIALVGELELVTIKGSQERVPAHRLIAVAAREPAEVPHSTLVGRDVEMGTVRGLVDESIAGDGRLLGVVGPAGIGKTRIVREAVEVAKSLGVEVFSTFCESHATDIPFGVVARLLRAIEKVSGLDNETARTRVRENNPGGDP